MESLQKQLIDAIISQKITFLPCSYENLEPAAKAILVKWLDDKSFPSDNPTELLGDQYVLAFSDYNTQLLVFTLSYEEAEQCGGSIILSCNGTDYSLVADNVRCSE